MKTHTVIGARLLSQSASPSLQRACEIALNHHERWDGGGYPRGLCKTEIPISARIMTIVDAYDAMSHDRIYRAALPNAEIVQQCREGQGTQFDPELIEVFLELMPEMQHIVTQNPDEPGDDLNNIEFLTHKRPAVKSATTATRSV